MTAIFKKELRSYFTSPVGYVCAAVLFALYGFYYYSVMLVGSTYYIAAGVYSSMFIWSMMILPILTMRSFSEEQKNKTDQALLTAPVGTGSIVLGKFLASAAVYGIIMLGSLVPAVVLSFFSAPNWALIAGTVFGSFLYGAAMLAIGIFISSLTQSQIVAAIGTFGVSILLVIVDQFSGMAGNETAAKILNWLSFNSRYTPFTNGIFNFASIVFFLSVAAVFLFLTARKLESRRWN
ncbi:ABC transporter permease [Anaeromassilibacillus senegalensis]|uniref:ABC transporter permease n=1 Tax=Anaeromassilibacillus senegalensis TaxID=1673717 RepID=UPI000682CAC2|nr:ABC transporter permease subunit [Anaeromassilibacillus senegalensis]